MMIKRDGEFQATGNTVTMLPSIAELGVQIKVHSCDKSPVTSVKSPRIVKANYIGELIEAHWVLIEEGKDYQTYMLEAYDAEDELEKRFIKIESKLSELSISINAIKSLITTKTKE